MFSAVFPPAQLGSWLMSIFAGLGAVPSNFTVPLTLTAVAGSIGVDAGAAAGVAGCSSVVSFLPQPASNTIPNDSDRLQIASDFFVFILFSASPLKISKILFSLLRSELSRVAAATFRGAASVRGPRSAHRCAHAPLLFRRELENIFDEELGVVLVVSVEGCGRGAGERPAIVFALEQAGRHGGAGADGLGVNDPAFDPIGFQATFGLQEVGGGGGLIVRRIAGGVALQARSGWAAEKAARHVRFLGGERRWLFRNVREGLARERLEETHQLAQFIFGERESGHAYLQIGADAVAVGVRVAERRLGEEMQEPLRIDTRAFGQQLRRKLLLRFLIAREGHQGSFLTGN